MAKRAGSIGLPAVARKLQDAIEPAPRSRAIKETDYATRLQLGQYLAGISTSANALSEYYCV
jgi:hypothetical protein